MHVGAGSGQDPSMLLGALGVQDFLSAFAPVAVPVLLPLHPPAVVDTPTELSINKDKI